MDHTHISKSIIIGVLLEEYERLSDMEKAYQKRGDNSIVAQIQYEREFIRKSFEANGLDLDKMVWNQWEMNRWTVAPKKNNHP
ncbi:hypothetical protein [Pelosinus propionicus]|uniref:Uncharacterized protein n=1 Tax=Pelosinus propionicus DSM 13327 TaxID=1123291 RepID=A0A1I4JUD6_9FIRM|nr:hypothetical protein [Pelosinus propionicus]SFL70152.1 hypothetical protein SAMN04490355_101429 [Pelosinus propionicus DSM 13327]